MSLADDDTIAYDVNTAAKKASVSRSTIYRLINDGELPSAKVRGSRVILRSDLIATLERLRELA
ncbi:MAG: helix-turn-helix domain-containing protein [Caulobacterales bacterium]|nr:helix-turn-helix domain-containing protein [Caulobacterales bacterium]